MPCVRFSAILVLLLAGCAGLPSDHTSLPPSPIQFHERLPPNGEWALYDVDLAAGSSVNAQLNSSLDFKAGTYDEERFICTIFSFANASLYHPVYNAEHPFGQASVSQSTKIVAGDYRLVKVVQSGDLGFTNDQVAFGAWNNAMHVPLLLGTYQHGAGASQTGAIRLNLSSAYQVTKIQRGPLWCTSGFLGSNPSTLVSTDGAFEAMDLQQNWTIHAGFAAYIHLESNIHFEVTLTGPQEHTWAIARNSTLATNGLETVVCATTPGDWKLKIPEIRGTGAPYVQFDLVVLDVGGPAFNAVPCKERI